jgi:hypothetical protein
MTKLKFMDKTYKKSLLKSTSSWLEQELSDVSLSKLLPLWVSDALKRASSV